MTTMRIAVYRKTLTKEIEKYHQLVFLGENIYSYQKVLLTELDIMGTYIQNKAR